MQEKISSMIIILKWLINDTTVETVVLLSKGMIDSRKVKVDFSLEDMVLSELMGKATYAHIKEYVLNETGLKVSSIYIAQVTPEKEEAIMQAFKHYGVI